MFQHFDDQHFHGGVSIAENADQSADSLRMRNAKQNVGCVGISCRHRRQQVQSLQQTIHELNVVKVLELPEFLLLFLALLLSLLLLHIHHAFFLTALEFQFIPVVVIVGFLVIIFFHRYC